ncbi:hypothetical protein DVH24_031443 [Malus domestica]|uniref:Uncharacterized protein n=1 Tax=Malus domestica TaxID=3750 RepID=A0A498HEA4_MALDO|nr:hypothetical protein DVH24_031443 [Malus domestica]
MENYLRVFCLSPHLRWPVSLHGTVEQATIYGWCGWSIISRLFSHGSWYFDLKLMGNLGPCAQDLPQLQIKFQICCPLCAWYRLRARNMAIDMGMVWHFFPGIVTMMGSSCALCSGSSWFFGQLVIFIISTVYATGEAIFRVIRFFCVVTFGPLQLGLSFWAPM